MWKYRNLIALLLCGVTLLCEIHGETISLTTCSQVEVQDAVNSAIDGDTIIVPAGSCDWTVGVLIEKKAITIMGAGIDQTIINDRTSTGFYDLPFAIEGQEGKPFRISGFTIVAHPTVSDTNGLIRIRGSARGWRIDHIKFDALRSGRGLSIGGKANETYGVVDHCIFVAPFDRSVQSISIFGDDAAAWTRPLTLGSDRAVYIEDNFFNNAFDNDGAVDAFSGARYVFRYNTVTNTLAGHHGLDSGSIRSPHSFEYYNNQFTTTFPIFTWLNFRGGTGVVHNNVVSGPYNRGISVINYRTCCEVSHNNCSNWGRCSGSNPIDGNQDATGYPCLDQVGRTTDMDGDGIQDLSPLYEWNNTLNGQDLNVGVRDAWGCTEPSMFDHLQEGRDFRNDTPMPNYTPFPYPHPLVTEGGPNAPTGLRTTSSN